MSQKSWIWQQHPKYNSKNNFWPEQVRKSNEKISIFNVCEKPKGNSADSLKISSTVVQDFGADLCTITTEDRSKQESSQIGDSKNKAILKGTNKY